MSTDPQPPAGVSAEEFARYTDSQNRKSARRSDGIEFSELVDQLKTLPPETAEERADRERRAEEVFHVERVSKFRRLCPPEFMQRVNRQRLVDPAAYDQVVAWDGVFPGPICSGPTGVAKSRAAWAALYGLNVTGKRSIAWFPVKRLLTEFLRYEAKDLADEFWRNYRSFDILFVDDLDKINWQFESEMAALFQFYDWIYREHRPCITTTNKDRVWWADKMGDAFARRLFDEAHRAVIFK